MRPAFNSRTKRRGAALELRLLFWAASDMWHPYGDLTQNWSALDRDYAANTCHDIECDDRRWNGCAYSSLPYCAAHPHAAHLHIISREGCLWRRFMTGRLAPSVSSRRSRSQPAAAAIGLIFVGALSALFDQDR